VDMLTKNINKENDELIL